MLPPAIRSETSAVRWAHHAGGVTPACGVTPCGVRSGRLDSNQRPPEPHSRGEPNQGLAADGAGITTIFDALATKPAPTAERFRYFPGPFVPSHRGRDPGHPGLWITRGREQ